MDLFSLGFGFILGVIVYTLVIYIAVKKVKKKKLKELEAKKGVLIDARTSFKAKENKSNK